MLELIDKKDNFEIVRDQIAHILAFETANQQALAIEKKLPAKDWKLRIFIEHSSPWEQYLDPDLEDTSPIVNVWYEGSSFDPSASQTIERQKSEGTFNIDCYGYGIAENLAVQGHQTGDKQATYEVQKAARLVRNILMAGENTHLQMQGLVWDRWPESISVFQPPFNQEGVQKVVGCRFVLRVTFNEFSPQVEPVDLEYLSVCVENLANGEVLAIIDQDYTQGAM